MYILPIHLLIKIYIEHCVCVCVCARTCVSCPIMSDSVIEHNARVMTKKFIVFVEREPTKKCIIKSSLIRAVKLPSHVQLFGTPWTVALQATLSMEFSRQECWSQLSFSPPGHLPDTGMESGSPELQADSLPSEPPVKPGGE